MSVVGYSTLDYVTGNSPDDLVKSLKAITFQFSILAIVPQGTRHVAYILKKEDSKAKQKLKIIKGV